MINTECSKLGQLISRNGQSNYISNEIFHEMEWFGFADSYGWLYKNWFTLKSNNAALNSATVNSATLNRLNSATSNRKHQVVHY